MSSLGSSVTAGEVLELITSGEARTRSALQQATGLSRSTVAERLEVLFAAKLIREGDESRPSGGRPHKMLALNKESQLILAADVGEDHIRLVVADLAGTVVAETVGVLAVTDGPEVAVRWLTEYGTRLLVELGRGTADLAGIALALPAPIDYARGEVTGPSVMTSWEGTSIEALVHKEIVVPVIVENDVNARGLGEYLLAWTPEDQVFYVKAGTGIGSAILTGGALFRGAQGAAGDIGHIRLDPEAGPLCRCGAVGCVESMAAGWSLVRDLRARGFDVSDTREFMAHVRRNTPEAVNLLRQAGRTLGRAIAYSVSLLNPNLVVVGGSLTGADNHLIMGVRESVYQYSLPLATRELRIVQAEGDEHCGAVGAAHLVIRRVLKAEQINSYLRSRT